MVFYGQVYKETIGDALLYIKENTN